MFKPPLRLLQRQAHLLSPRQSPQLVRGVRRFGTTPIAPRSRSLRNTALRLGLAAGAVYYYNTSSVFAEEPVYPPAEATDSKHDESSAETLDSIAAASRRQRSTPSSSDSGMIPGAPDAITGEPDPPRTPEEYEEQAESEGAFNPETGEINWDCPCLGGMAHGPCGEQFRAAFGCFVYSKDEPKGMDCIEHFKTMQDCFRKYPEMYGPELDDDDEAVEGVERPVEALDSTPKGPEISASPTPSAYRPTLDEVAEAKALRERDPLVRSEHAPDMVEDKGQRPPEATPPPKRNRRNESDLFVPKAGHEVRGS
ncbi:MAG: hypothetical protein M1823_001712 [Watsoniomyces obsoletus]|nr:MAG: hypothetical protein M1823_001712 [Watsoniomyces obsoletus]